VNIADIASMIYAMEAVVLRTEKAIQNTGLDKNKQKLLYTQLFCQEAFGNIERDAKETLVATETGDTLRMMTSALRKFTRFTPINIIATKREAAEKLVEAERFIV